MSTTVRRRRARGSTTTRLLLLLLATTPASAADAPAPSGTITLPVALDAALERNPELSALALTIDQLGARTRQADRAPNPNLATEVEDVAGSGVRRGWHTGQTTVSIAQLVELGGKRAARRRAAELDRTLAGVDYDARRLAVLGNVAKAFAATLAAQERVALARESEALAAASVRSVTETVTTGAVSPIEASRAEVAAARATTDRREAERDLDAARVALAALWGDPTPSFAGVAGDLSQMPPPRPLDALLAEATSSPALARWSAERAQREAAVALERARAVPDVTVSVGGRHYADDGDGALVLGFSLPLPLFDRNRDGIAAAELAVERAARERRAAEIAVGAMVRTDYGMLRTALDEAATLRRHTIPAARRTWDGARDAYLRGLFRYLEVLDAQRTLFDLRGRLIDVELRYHEAAADLTRLTGAAPDARTPGSEADR